MENKKCNKIFHFILYIVLVICFCIFCYSGYKIYRWYIDNKKNSELALEMKNSTKIDEVKVEDREDIEDVNPPASLNDTYWYYKNMSLINVDFGKLISTNPNTVGWIYVGGTSIDYPVVQSSNNSYYLNHSFDNSYNGAGWIFMDYRNSTNDLGKNTIIYGHSMKDHSMFWSMRKTLSNDWYNNKDNHIIKFSTPYQNTLWQVFSVYTIKSESYYITTDYQIDQTWEITNNNVIIEGNNHTIYGNGNQSFDITGNNVTIQNLNFVNCNSSGSGGAIYFSGSGSGSDTGITGTPEVDDEGEYTYPPIPVDGEGQRVGMPSVVAV